MGRLTVLLAALVFPAAGSAAMADREDEAQGASATSLVQHNFSLAARAPAERGVAGKLPVADFALIKEDMQSWLDQGSLSEGRFPTSQRGACGKSTRKDLTKSLVIWRRQNPGVDGFCYFANRAWWFIGRDTVSDYVAKAKKDNQAMQKEPGLNGFGTFKDGTGPSLSLVYDGARVTWSHVDNFVDLVDDPYCYSLGWLKGQRVDGSFMSDTLAWEALASAECDRLESQRHYAKEEVTVADHLVTKGIYMHRTACAMTGTCDPVTKDVHYRFAYANCVLSNKHVAAEMAYCYYKGCLLKSGNVGHRAECGY